MFALLPILAQSLSIAVGDRTEVRQVFSDEERWQDLESVPSATVGLGFERTSLELTYAPNLLYARYNRPERELLVFHNANLVGTWRATRRLTLTLTQSAGYGERNFLLSTLGPRVDRSARARTDSTPPPDPGPAPPGGTPPGGGTAPPGGGSTPGGTVSPETRFAALDETFDFMILRTGAAMTYALSRASSLGASAGYNVSGGVGDARDVYPRFQGPDASVSYTWRPTPLDQLVTSSRTEYSWSGDDSFFSARLEQGYTHQFGRYVSLGGSVGLIYTRIEDDGDVVTAFYPTLGLGSGAGLTYETPLAGGTFSIGATAGYSPVFDTVSTSTDPRVFATLRTSYSRRRFTVYAEGTGTFSVTPDDAGALNALIAELGARQGLPAGFMVDGGARISRQSYEGEDLVPTSYVLFLGLSWQAACTRINTPAGMCRVRD